MCVSHVNKFMCYCHDGECSMHAQWCTTYILMYIDTKNINLMYDYIVIQCVRMYMYTLHLHVHLDYVHVKFTCKQSS